MKVNRKKVRTFFLVLICILIPVTLFGWLTKDTTYWTYILAGLYMPMPAAAAIITQKLIYHQPIRELGFSKINFKWLLLFPIGTSLIMFSALLLGSLILGNLLNVPGFGYITEDTLTMIRNIVPADVPIPSDTNLPPVGVLIPLTFISAVLAGFTINGLFALGEELGWRGFLMNELKPLGFFKSNLLIGIVWGFWHAPIILMGYNDPENPVLGVFAMNLVTIPLAYIYAIARIKANNVLASAIGHGAFNGFVGLTIMLLVGANLFLGTALGLLGFVASSTLALILYLINKKEIIKWYS